MSTATNEYRARREAEWAIAKLSEPAVRILFLMADEETIKLAWMLGWQQGALSAKSQEIEKLQAATDRAMGKR